MTKTILRLATAATALALCGTVQAAVFVRTFEAPGAQTVTSVPLGVAGVETFDGRGAGPQGFVTDFGSGGKLTGTFIDFDLRPADLYGGAGGTGDYLALFSGQSATLDLTRADGQGVNYLGFWLSALNGGNTVTFFDKGVQVAQFDASTVFDGIANLGDYACNPNGGGNCGEPYAFVNFTRTDGLFDRVVFSQTAGGGLEVDNLTVGLTAGLVPEPAAWTMMIAGFGLLGASLRRRGAAAYA